MLDAVSGPAAIGHIAQVLRPGGRLLSTVYAVDAGQLAEGGLTAVNVVRPQGAEVLDRLSRMVEAGARLGDAASGRGGARTGAAATRPCARQAGFDGRLRRNRGWHLKNWRRGIFRSLLHKKGIFYAARACFPASWRRKKRKDTKMKAAVLHTFGETPHFEEFAEPVLDEGEVLVQVLAAGLHPIEGVSPVNRILLPFIHEIYDFHPLLCPLRTSRFLTPKLSRQGVGPLPPAEASRPLCYEYKKVHLASVCAR